jgi:hypothetical protein
MSNLCLNLSATIPDDTTLVNSVLLPFFRRTPQRRRFVATFLGADNRILSVQTLALCPPPSRRIDCKRLLSLARWPQDAAGVVLAHNDPAQVLPGFDAALTETVGHFASLCAVRSVQLLDYLILGSERYARASRSAHQLEIRVRGWS